MKIKHLSFGSIAFGEVLFPRFVPKERTEITLPNMLILVEEMIINSSSRLLIYDHRIPHSLSFRAALFLENTEYLNGMALIVTPGLNKKVAGILKLKSRTFPIELFFNKNEASSWLSLIQEIGIMDKRRSGAININFQDASTKNVG